MTSRHRLRGRGRFAAVRAEGIRAGTGLVRLTVAGNGQVEPRVGFALPGQRSAVVRNRLRRRLREAVRPLLPRLQGLDVVVSAGPGASHCAFTELVTDLGTAVDRAVERSAGTRQGATTDNAPMTPRPARP